MLIKFPALVAGAATLVAAGLAGQEPAAVAYVDRDAILAQAPGASEAQEELDRQIEGFEREIQEMQTRLDSMVTAFQQQSSTLLPNVRVGRETEINQFQLRLQQRVDQMGQEVEQSRVALFTPILNQMNQTLEAIRAERGLGMVIDLGAVAAADSSLDLTEEVVARMRAAVQ